ncbi:ubiquitin carboxyl-terminal hydrolase [Anaeramoeba ignava]|uniref:Ubiquitin carboxyl-terminal hydrolase n=1 Tax=Anaeramoeba ignava TaxID=1746090 RepID=A0A9Q0RAT9_ANAIG|nr:ubiquitin carboxyl-terminal hydrolase [Anaeramoeba ignava]
MVDIIQHLQKIRSRIVGIAFNDSVVYEIDENQIKSSTAYILFYEREEPNHFNFERKKPTKVDFDLHFDINNPLEKELNQFDEENGNGNENEIDIDIDIDNQYNFNDDSDFLNDSQ